MSCSRTQHIDFAGVEARTSNPSIPSLKRHGLIQRGGQGVRTPPPLKNHKTTGSFSTTGRDLLKNYISTNEASIQCWAIIGTPVKRHLAVYVTNKFVVLCLCNGLMPWAGPYGF